MLNDFSIGDAELIYMMCQMSECSFKKLMSFYNRLLWKRSHEAMNSQSFDGVSVDDFYQEGAHGFYQSLYGFRIDRLVGLAFYISMCVGSGIKTTLRKCRTQSYRLINSKNSLDIFVSEDENISLLDTLSDSRFSVDPANMAWISEVKKVCEVYLMSLSDLENDVYQLHEAGFSYKEIADIHNISSKDVDNTLQKIRRKVKVLTRDFED